MMSSKNYFGYFWESSGIRLLDYENNVILPDEEALGDFLYAYKTYFHYDDEKVGEIYILPVLVMAQNLSFRGIYVLAR